MTVELALRTTALLTVAVVVSAALRGMTAGARHAHWRRTTLAALALPALSLLSPAWSVPVRLPDANGQIESLLVLAATTTVESATPAPAHPSRAFVIGDAGAVGLVAGWPAVWAVGSATTSLLFAAGYFHLWLTRRRARPAPSSWTAAAARLAARAGLALPPAVLVSSEVPGPLVCGTLRPTVLIPPEACAWAADRRDAVLIHELAHVRRGDLSAQLASQALVVLHWFNPLAWVVLFRMRRERELACDDEVLRAGVAPLVYATELLAIATARKGPAVPAAALSMARPSELEGRLLAVLETAPRRARPAAQACLSAALITASVAVAGARVERLDAAPPTVDAWRNRGMALLPVPLDRDPADPEAGVPSTSDDAAARQRATTALALTSGARVIPALLAALDDPDPHVREKAAAGLAWRRDPKVVPALLKAMTDPDPHVREKALVALAFSGAPDARRAIETARTDPDSHVREKATTLLRPR